MRGRADGDIGVWKLEYEEGGGFIPWAKKEIETKGRQTVKELTGIKVESIEYGGPESVNPRR